MEQTQTPPSRSDLKSYSLPFDSAFGPVFSRLAMDMRNVHPVIPSSIQISIKDDVMGPIKLTRGIYGFAVGQLLNCKEVWWLARLIRGHFRKRWLFCDGWHGWVVKGSAGNEAQKRMEVCNALHVWLAHDFVKWTTWGHWHCTFAEWADLWPVTSALIPTVDRQYVLCMSTIPSWLHNYTIDG